MEKFINDLKELNYSLEKKAKDLGDSELEEMYHQVDEMIKEFDIEIENAAYSNGYTDGESQGYNVGFAEGVKAGRAEGGDL